MSVPKGIFKYTLLQYIGIYSILTQYVIIKCELLTMTVHHVIKQYIICWTCTNHVTYQLRALDQTADRTSNQHFPFSCQLFYVFVIKGIIQISILWVVWSPSIVTNSNRKETRCPTKGQLKMAHRITLCNAAALAASQDVPI